MPFPRQLLQPRHRRPLALPRHRQNPAGVRLRFQQVLIISGSPNPDRKRAWLLNLESDPNLTFHLKWSVNADLPATARVVTDPSERRAIAEWVVTNAWKNQDVEAMTLYSPMIEVTIAGLAD